MLKEGKDFWMRHCIINNNGSSKTPILRITFYLRIDGWYGDIPTKLLIPDREFMGDKLDENWGMSDYDGYEKLSAYQTRDFNLAEYFGEEFMLGDIHEFISEKKQELRDEFYSLYRNFKPSILKNEVSYYEVEYADSLIRGKYVRKTTTIFANEDEDIDVVIANLYDVVFKKKFIKKELV